MHISPNCLEVLESWATAAYALVDVCPPLWGIRPFGKRSVYSVLFESWGSLEPEDMLPLQVAGVDWNTLVLPDEKGQHMFAYAHSSKFGNAMRKFCCWKQREPMSKGIFQQQVVRLR